MTIKFAGRYTVSCDACHSWFELYGKKCVNDYAEPVQIDILFHERNLENCARMKESVWNVL